MAELAKKLHFLKNGTEQTAKIYTTTNEVGTNYISVKVDGTTGYVPINDISHGNSTIGRVTKGGSTYAILSRFAQILSYVGTATATPNDVGGNDEILEMTVTVIPSTASELVTDKLTVVDRKDGTFEVTVAG